MRQETGPPFRWQCQVLDIVSQPVLKQRSAVIRDLSLAYPIVVMIEGCYQGDQGPGPGMDTSVIEQMRLSWLHVLQHLEVQD